VSGVVESIEVCKTANGQCEHIVVKNDGKDEAFVLPILNDPSKEEIVARARDAGIVGMGGAGFPSNVKFSPKETIDRLVINAAECEPYITCDYRIMMEYPTQFLKGVLLIAKALGMENSTDGIIVGVEDNKPKAIQKLKETCVGELSKINIKVLKAKYPQGGEKQLVYATTGRKVGLPPALPSGVGVCVSNVSTALALYYAVVEGQSLYKRVLTVTGNGVGSPKNFWVRVGTDYQTILDHAQGLKNDTLRLVSGGPMMGFAVSSTDIYTTKTTSCLLAMREMDAPNCKVADCINCAKCSQACPMNLSPMYMNKFVLTDDYQNAIKYGLKNCIDCGCCSYACPAKLPLVQVFRYGKGQVRTLGL